MSAPPMAPTNKHDRRAAMLSPHAAENRASIQAQLRHPVRLREYMDELRAAVDAEGIDRLHVGGVETDQGTTVRMRATAIAKRTEVVRPADNVIQPKSAWLHEQNPIDTPRWLHDFRTLLAGSPFMTYEDEHGVHWQSPHRAALARMQNDGSSQVQLAAQTAYLLPRNRYSPTETFHAQAGWMQNRQMVLTADSWVHWALTQWWKVYVERPRGKPI